MCGKHKWLHITKGRKFGFPIIGSTKQEVIETLHDLKNANVDIVTIGQYLQPSADYAPIKRCATPEEFANWKEEALELGIKVVESGPLVRSSYHADEQSDRFSAEEKASA